MLVRHLQKLALVRRISGLLLQVIDELPPRHLLNREVFRQVDEVPLDDRPKEFP